MSLNMNAVESETETETENCSHKNTVEWADGEVTCADCGVFA